MEHIRITVLPSEVSSLTKAEGDQHTVEPFCQRVLSLLPQSDMGNDEIRITFDLSAIKKGLAVSSSFIGALVQVRNAAMRLVSDESLLSVTIENASQHIQEKFKILNLSSLFSLPEDSADRPTDDSTSI